MYSQGLRRLGPAADNRQRPGAHQDDNRVDTGQVCKIHLVGLVAGHHLMEGSC